MKTGPKPKPDSEASRQLLWQRKMTRARRCVICGEAATVHKLCLKHYADQQQRLFGRTIAESVALQEKLLASALRKAKKANDVFLKRQDRLEQLKSAIAKALTANT